MEITVTDETAVAAAYSESLSKPNYFGGRKVIAREAARYKHQNPRSANMATSSVVDKVLLDDGTEVWQCRVCGDSSWDSVLGAVSHAGAHNRKPRGTTGKVVGVRSISAELDEAQAVVTRSSRATGRKEVSQDVRGIMRTMTAIAVQLDHMGSALRAATSQLAEYTEGVTSGPTPEELAEIAELREKAGKYDQMRGLFS